jgi:hypothetical protein
MMTSLFSGSEFESAWVASVRLRYLGFYDATDPDVASETSALDSSGNYASTEATVISSTQYFEAAGATNTGYVTEVFRHVLRREPDPSGLSYWVGRLNAGTSTRSQVASTIIRSNESAGLRVAGLSSMTSCVDTELLDAESLDSGSFCIVLDRMADPSGKTYWTGQLAGTGQLPTLWANNAASNEYFNLAQP